MNKMRLIAVTLGILVLLFASNSFAEDSAITLAGLEGKVLVKIAPSTEWAAAAVDQKLKVNDSIKTGDDGKALLEFSDKSSVALKTNTELIINDLVWTGATRKADLNMPSGDLRAVISKVGGPSQFKVRTPTAICGAHGTVFYIMVVGNETRVFVTDGAVDFSNADGSNSYVVVQNMTAISDLSGNVSQPRELTGDEKAQALAGWDGAIAEPYEAPEGQGGNDAFNDDSQVTPEAPADKQPISQI
jgi:Uncharacterized protein conserved in bacteria